MKRQFINMKPSQGKGTPGQAPAKQQHSPLAPQENSPSNASNKGLLSQYKSGTLEDPHAPAQERVVPTIHDVNRAGSVIERLDTVEHHAIPTPSTGPIHKLGFPIAPNQQPPLQQYSPAYPHISQLSPSASGISQLSPSASGISHLSPSASGVTPFNGFVGNMPPQYSPVTQPGAPFVSATGQPISRPLSGNLSWNGQPPSGQLPYPNSQHVRPPRKKRRVPIWARVLLAVMAVIMVLIGGGALYYQTTFGDAISSMTGQEAAKFPGRTSNTSNSTIKQPNIGTDRINILLLGSNTDGKDDAPHNEINILVTIDPKTHYVGMLSIPRDLYLTIPNHTQGKLDFAFNWGWLHEHVGPTPWSNGVGLAKATIEQAFNIPIHYYAWVGLDGFIRVIDSVGGIDIDISRPILDDVYPDESMMKVDQNAVKRLYIAPGPQHMTGKEALEYVRSRHSDLSGDFGRSERQQQVLTQLKLKLQNSNMLENAPQLLKALNGYVKTDMKPDQIIEMMNYARSIDTKKVDRVVLSPPYSSPGGNIPGVGEVVVGNCDMILPKIKKMFALEDAQCNLASTGQANAHSTTLQTSAPLPVQQQSAFVSTTSPTTGLTSMVKVGAMSLQQGNGDLFGVQGILDLVYLTVFQSL